jgi:uncharacterized protein (TIGR02757 family)
MIDKDTASLLVSEANRINRPEFIELDPVQFPRMFSELRDVEIAAFLTAIISWGKRSMILRDANRMLALMSHEPYKYVMEQGYEDLDPTLNIHRTFFAGHMQWFMRGLREIYSRHNSLDEFCAATGAAATEAPAWKLIEEISRITCDANGGEACARCLPTNLRTTALKRVNMALRWLVRDDGIVDMGVWKSIPKSRLFIPLDVHVGNTARGLGLLDRKANDRKSVEQLTASMREICPEDPVLLDYALFGIGVEGGLGNNADQETS